MPLIPETSVCSALHHKLQQSRLGLAAYIRFTSERWGLRMLHMEPSCRTGSLPVKFAQRSSITWEYLGSISMVRQLRAFCSHPKSLEPEPPNGSTTISPGRLVFHIWTRSAQRVSWSGAPLFAAADRTCTPRFACHRHTTDVIPLASNHTAPAQCCQ